MNNARCWVCFNNCWAMGLYRIKTFCNFFRSVWLFPILLTVLLLVLTTLKISGTSVGIYHKLYYGNTRDPSLLANHPQPIRSDEWLVTTQLTIAQSAAGFPRINPNIDSGRDMTVVGDAPAKDWSTIFRPQNLSFFVLPLEYAFAFKWWLLLYLTIISCYFLALRILPHKRTFAILFSIAIACSPFLFWWYETGTFAPMFYGFFIILLAYRILGSEKVLFLRTKPTIYSQLIYAATLAYLLSAFALVLYPPFQIPIAIAVVFFITGLVLNKYGLTRKLYSRSALKKFAVFSVGLMLAGSTIFVFFHTRSNAVSAITNTAYPGKRKVLPEGNSAFELFSSYLQPQLQRPSRAAHFFTNQSEASDFILLLPFLFIPGLVIIWGEFQQRHKMNWPLLSIEACAGLFFAYLFIPALSPLYKLIYLNQVANVRLFIGLGFIGALQLALIISALQRIRVETLRLNVFTGIYALVCLIPLGATGYYARSHYPQFINNVWLIVGLVIVFSSIIFFFLSRRTGMGVALFLLLTLGSIYKIHPLYKGLGPIYHSTLSQAIDNVSNKRDAWAVLDSIYYENLAAIADRDSLSGVKPYPDVRFWRQVDGSKDDYIYNRYAHVIFVDDPMMKSSLKLTQADTFEVKFSCSTFIEHYVRYALASHRLDDSCTSEIEEVHYPETTFYIYKVSLT